MSTDSAEQIIEAYERGMLNRRELASGLIGLGAAMAVSGNPVVGEAAGSPTGETTMFSATGLDHVALNVNDVTRSREFYVTHLGLEVVREGSAHCFLGYKTADFCLALFEREPAGLNHYCYNIRRYDPDRAQRILRDVDLKPRREADRLYFDDPDGIEVQITGS